MICSPFFKTFIMLLSKMYQKVNRITNNFELFVRDAVNNVHLELEQMQREQMLSGKDSGGNDIGRYRSREHIAFRQAMNKQTAFVDLYVTGEFQSKATVQANENEVYYFSKSDKTESILNLYGERIFGLSNKQKRTEIIETELLKLIKNELQ